MIEAFSHMLWPLMACFVLVGIHAYLGVHVLARKVIFVDLALAQIAALGAVYGVFIGLSLEANSWAIKGVSVAFTLLGALLFSFTRTPDERVPHEAIIGIIYAATLSMTVLVTTNLPHGADEVRQMLAGSILWVTKDQVLITAVLYAFIGIIHVIFRRQFFLLSTELALRTSSTLNIKLWDFLFYATFGVVVTSSVGMGGVLLVFGYLVIPSVIGVMLASKTLWRLIIGWGSGVLMSVVGVIVSFYADLPSGPTIVVLLSALLVAISLVLEVRNNKTRRLGFFHLSMIGLILGALVALPIWFHDVIFAEQQEIKSRLHILTHEQDDRGEQVNQIRSALSSKNQEEVMQALELIRNKKLVLLVEDVAPFLRSNDNKVRELAVKVLAKLKDKRALPHLSSAIAPEKDVYIKIEMAEALLSLGDVRGLVVLENIMSTSSIEFAKEDALMHLNEWLIGAPSSAKELAVWLKKNHGKIRFDELKNKFYLE